MSAGSSEPPGLDDLRRRLYGPDASAEDVARYEVARGQPETVPAPPPRTIRRPRRRWIAVVAGAVLVLAVVLAVGVAARRPVAARSPSAAPRTAIVEGQVQAPATARLEFVDALAAGSAAGLLDYLSAHPDLLPPALRTVHRGDSTEYAGEGPSTLALSPSALAEQGGRATVIVVLARTGRFTWRATRVAAARARLAPGPVTTSDSREAQAGAPVSGTFAYGSGAPARLSMLVPEGTRWGAVVVFTD